MTRLKMILLGAVGLTLLFSVASTGQNVMYQAKYATLLQSFDLDGEAADADQLIVATAIVDNGTSVGDVNYTIVAQPDTCRLLNLTLVDTDMTAGVITVAGTGCLNEAKTCNFTYTAGDDTGVKTLSCVGGEGAYFSTVTSLTNGVMTGESDETLALGYAGVNSVTGWGMYGVLLPLGPNQENGVDPFGSIPVAKKITTAGLAGTTIAGVVAADDPFLNVAAGDLLLINLNGIEYERKVVTWGSADSVVVDSNIVIPAAGVTFRYKEPWFSTNPHDIVMIPVEGYSTIDFLWSIDANANTGGVITKLECTMRGPEWPIGKWNQLESAGPPIRTAGETTTASAATQVPYLESIDLTQWKYTHCRFGLRFGTGDDADAAAEDINLQVALTR